MKTIRISLVRSQFVSSIRLEALRSVPGAAFSMARPL